MADLAAALGLDGIIATNTTISRDGLASDPARGRARSAPAASPAARSPSGRWRCSGCCAAGSATDLTLVAVGGITTVDDARARLDAGADPAPGLHRVRLRGPAVAAPHRCAGSRGRRPGRHDASPARPVHVTGEVLASKRVGAYHHLTLAAPGVPERFRPGTFVALSAGPGGSARRAMWIHRVKPTGGYGATIELVVEPRRPRHPLAGRPAGRRPARGHRAARPAVRAAQGAGQLRAGRRGVRRRAALPARRAAARARVRGDPGRRRRRRGAPAVRTGGAALGPRGHRRHRRRLGRRTRRRGRRARPRCWSRRAPRSSTPPDRAATLHAVAGRRRAAGRLEPDRGRGADDLRDRAVPGLRRAGRGRGRRRPAWCAPAPTGRCSAATGSAGTTWSAVR